MIFAWLRRRRRRKLQTLPFPESWRRYIEEHVPLYSRLLPEEREKLHGIVLVLLHEKRWEGCGGLSVTEEIKVSVAAQAALLILHLDHDYYSAVKSIVLYPSTFLLPEARHEAGWTIEEDVPVLGLAQHRGPVVLSWDAARQGAYDPADGANVVFHEFAHKLDMLDDEADGTPVLETREHHRNWVRIMTEEFEAHRERAGRGKATVLDAYGAEDPAEFFAVATECFFEKSAALRARHPDLYALLRSYYRQDPAARLEGSDEGKRGGSRGGSG